MKMIYDYDYLKLLPLWIYSKIYIPAKIENNTYLICENQNLINYLLTIKI